MKRFFMLMFSTVLLLGCENESKDVVGEEDLQSPEESSIDTPPLTSECYTAISLGENKVRIIEAPGLKGSRYEEYPRVGSDCYALPESFFQGVALGDTLSFSVTESRGVLWTDFWPGYTFVITVTPC